MNLKTDLKNAQQIHANEQEGKVDCRCGTSTSPVIFFYIFYLKKKQTSSLFIMFKLFKNFCN